jgi:pilus assembly protein FimV
MADIAQEAEFFIELGENDRAIALLESSLETENSLIPVPQLLLLDLYRKTDNEPAYNAMRDDFAERFNASVPTWEEDPNSSRRELADYPRALEQVCRSWRSDNIVPTLEALLVDDTRGSRLGFDLPAYREVIFLYGIAKQLELDSDGLKLDLELTHSMGSSELMDSGRDHAHADIDFELPMDAPAQATKLDVAHSSVSSAKKSPPAQQWEQTIAVDSKSIDFDLDEDLSKPSKS